MLPTTTSLVLVVLLIIFLIIAVIYDAKQRRIPNYLSLGAIPIFLLAGFISMRFDFFVLQLLGALAMFIIWWIMWMFKIVGGGDHKVMIAVGAATGLSLVLPITLATILVGGIQALVFISMLWLAGCKSTITNKKLPYTVSILFGTALALLGRFYSLW